MTHTDSKYLSDAARQTRTEEQAREELRERSLADLQAAAKRDGVSDRLTDEMLGSLRSAFLVGDMFRAIMGAGK